MDINQIIAWRRHLHKYPELSRQEFKTSQYIYDELSQYDNIRLSRPTQTSVVAEIGTGKPVILFRADIDALAGYENITEDYKSVNEGVVHTCGHDTHTAMMMGVARELSEHVQRLHGTVRIVFQHSEEKKPSGAEELVSLGICKDVKCAFGLHIEPCQPTGAILITEGPTTTASSRFEMTIQGRGAHTATPEASIDPILIGSEIVTSVQSIVSRNVSPSQPAVLSFGEFKSGTASSIIPDTAFLTGSMRSYSRELTDYIEQRFCTIVKHICEMHSAKVEIKCTKGLPSIYNNPEICKIVKDAAVEAVGKEKVICPATPPNGADDFAYYSLEVPSCFFRLGGGEAKDGYKYMNHSPNFRIDENCFLNGAKTFVNIAYHILK